MSPYMGKLHSIKGFLSSAAFYARHPITGMFKIAQFMLKDVMLPDYIIERVLVTMAEIVMYVALSGPLRMLMGGIPGGDVLAIIVCRAIESVISKSPKLCT